MGNRKLTMTPSAFLIIRHELDMTQKQLSSVSGITLRCIQYYESGQRKVPSYIEKLMHALLKIKIMENKEYFKYNKPQKSVTNKTIGQP